MTDTQPTIVFFGAGPVALASLQALQQYCRVEAVITKPQKGRHQPEVLGYCEQTSLPSHTPANKQELQELFEAQRFQAPVGIVVDYGIIIPLTVFEAFSFGILNSHFSLLPEWRGADPITFAVLSGQKETGVSIMKIVAALDEGPLLDQASLPIDPTDTAEALTQRLIALSNQLLQKLLPQYLAGSIKLRPQSTQGVTYSRLLTKQDGQLDPTKPALQLEREIRAFQPWPKSYLDWHEQRLIILQAKPSSVVVPTGTLQQHQQGLYFGCQDGSLEIIELQPAGKKPMSAQAFINGYRELLTI